MDFVEYHVDNARQFWAELEDIVHIPSSASLNRIDSALRTFITFCSTYHEKYLSTPDQLEHAISLLLDSDIFSFHSDRSTEHLVSAAHSETNPHALLVLYSIFLQYGRRNPAFFGASASIPSQAGRVGVGLDALTPMVPQGKRSAGHKRWQGLVPLLMDHVRWSVDDDGALGIPIEARLRLVCVCLLYEVCRVQKLDMNDLKVFDDGFIEHLFETIEDTSVAADETLNYYLIKLIVALNEQFMVASLVPHRSKAASESGKSPQSQTFQQAHQRAASVDRPPNRVLEILMRRLYSSQTFGANIIFMLNRAENTAEDLCMQLLLLKMLYLLFTTPGTHEYFYTNDLRVLVDVFIRELGNLPEESESLRHTYLRVLHPLLTNTQLKSNPYKQPELRQMLLGLISHAHIRDVNPTTRRLAERCLNAEWCRALGPIDIPRVGSTPRANSLHGESIGGKSLSAKASTMDLLQAQVPFRSASAEPMLRSLDKLRVGEKGNGNGSTASLTDLAVANAPPPLLVRGTSARHTEITTAARGDKKRTAPAPPTRRVAPDTSTPPLSPSKSSTYSSASEPKSERRKAPAPPRRTPPAVPPGCARCDYDNPGALVTCTTCSTVYCTLTESPNDIPCLRLAPGSDPNQFQCLECYHCLGPDQDEPWPHTFHSPRTRFNADSIDKCPEAEHTNCGGLAAHVVFEPDVKSIAVAFAQYLRGIWQGTGRALYVSCYECSNSSREVKICKVQTDQSSWSNEGRYCRVLVFYFASKSGLARDEILKMVARPREYFSVVTSPSTKPWTGFVLFAPGPVPDRKEFLNKLNQAAALDSYSFGRIAIYFTTTASASISLAFDPTILMVRACWGRSLGYYNSIIDGWMRDRSANEIVVFMAERGKLAQVCVYRDFEKHGWSLDVPLALCDCTNVVETIHTPKRWDFVETNHPGAVTTVTLQCSLCEAEKVFPKPDHVQSPNIQFGSYYSTFMADIGPTAGIADV